MYHETYHPVSPETLKFVIENKSYSDEERNMIVAEVTKANNAQIRHFTVNLPSGEFVEFDNGIYIGGKAE